MQTMTIESYGNNVLDETMSKRRSNSVVLDARVAYQPFRRGSVGG